MAYKVPDNSEVTLFPSGLILLAQKLGFSLTTQDAVSILAQYGPLTVKLAGDFPDQAIVAEEIKAVIEKYLANPKAHVQ